MVQGEKLLSYENMKKKTWTKASQRNWCLSWDLKAEKMKLGEEVEDEVTAF